MKRFPSLLLMVMAAWIMASGWPLPQVSNEEFIQGTWRIDGYLNQAQRRGRWYQEWTFEHGKFKEEGYPPLRQAGSYRVLNEDGDKLTLELHDQEGTFGSKNSRLEIVINRQKDQLKIGSNEPFLRIKPKSCAKSNDLFLYGDCAIILPGIAQVNY